jgi:hypothetical protein
LRALIGLALLGAIPATHATEGPKLRLAGGVQSVAAGEAPVFGVGGLPAPTLAALRGRALPPAAWASVFSLHVGSPEAEPMAARHQVTASALRLEPRFPFAGGLTYVAVFRPDALDRLLGTRRTPAPRDVTLTLAVPRPPPSAPAVVSAVYPSGTVVPANLLRFYLHFSAPMDRREVYEHVRILDRHGKEVAAPFVRPETRLWDPAGQRVTLLFDPGRIKSKLVARETHGMPLSAGYDYQLVVSRAWKDAEGKPLARGLRHRFRVSPQDHASPRPDRWRFAAPPAGSRAPLRLALDEPLDRALLEHMIWIERGSARLGGKVDVHAQETIWSFTPDEPWLSEAHRLVADTELEDRAGNRIAAPFEVDLTSPPPPPAAGGPTWQRAFTPRRPRSARYPSGEVGDRPPPSSSARAASPPR